MDIAFDHLVITAGNLPRGAAETEAALGVALVPGGSHPAMGTHNRLLPLGPGAYLEVIAPDPGAPAPGHPRWFGLDDGPANARLTHWVARCGDLDAALAGAPGGTGTPMAMRRGALRWRMAVSPTGHQPFDDCFPALIEWPGTEHPARSMPDAGCRLVRFEITHPDDQGLSAALGGMLTDPRIVVRQGGAPGLRALIGTPSGDRWLA